METSTDARPRVLLVEDDATTRAVLTRLLGALPVDVDAAGDMSAALARAAVRRHAVWLLDAHLPDGCGRALLAGLRRLHGDVPAIAHTASHDPALARRLRAAGFIDVLAKPVAAARLLAAVGMALEHGAACARAPCPPPAPAAGPLPVLDDAAAALALGDGAHVASVRALFAAELAMLELPAGLDPAADWHALHRLRAGCGFVGAPRLARAAAALQAQADPQARAGFRRALDETLAALQAAVAGS